MKTSRLDPYLQKQVELGSSGIDIMHGALKTIMHEFENKNFEVCAPRAHGKIC